MKRRRCRTVSRIEGLYRGWIDSSRSQAQRFHLGAKERNPSSLNEDAMTFAPHENRMNDCHLNWRVRPRLPHLLIRTTRSNMGSRVVDVAHLQDYPDRLSALRECIWIMYDSVTEVYRRLDRHGNGSLTLAELGNGLNKLHVPWQQVTGLTRVQLFDLIDPTSSGFIEILAFLGKTLLTPRPDWTSLSIQEQWDEYCKRVLDMDMTYMIPNPPIWNTVFRSRVGDECDTKLRRMKTDPRFNSRLIKSDGNPGELLSREDLDFIQTKLVRIEKFLKDFNENKRELTRIKHELSNITECAERASEQKRRREEEERERQRVKTEAGMALVRSENGRISLFGRQRGVHLSQFEKPNEIDLLSFFCLSNPGLISRDEMHFRNLLRNIGLSLIDGDKVKALFVKHTGTPIEVNEIQFVFVLRDLLKMPPELVPTPRFRGYWVSAGGGKEKLSLHDFLWWYAYSGILNA
jgi:hypothetical protein